jgi:putative ABC transport system permease protein
VVRSVRGMPGVAAAANVAYLTLQVQKDGQAQRVMVVGMEPGMPGAPGYLVAGRHITRNHYEAVADVKTGYALGDVVRIRRHDYTVVGLTRRMVSSGGDPMLFVPMKDAQETQFLKDNDAIVNDRARTAANPAFNRPGSPGLLESVQNLQTSSRNVNAVLVQIAPGFNAEQVAEPIRRWKHLNVFTRDQMEDILVVKLIANSAKQIGMFLVILAIVSAAIVAFIIYTMTMGKLREIMTLGIPIGLTILFEAMLFNAMTLVVGTFGAAPLAAHGVALNFASVTFMIPLGVAMAATVRVGRFAGAGDRGAALAELSRLVPEFAPPGDID